MRAWKYRENRTALGFTQGRECTCKTCGATWHSEKLGVQNRYDKCKEKAALKAQSKSLESRTKTCAYRHCGRTFVDNSDFTGMFYCHDEHRRREKLFRSGQAVDLSYFRNPDPILEPKDQ